MGYIQYMTIPWLHFVMQSWSEVSAVFGSSYAGVLHASVQTAHHPKRFVIYKNKMRRVQEEISGGTTRFINR